MPLDLKDLSILVVEDTQPMQELLVSLLASLGFKKPYTADNGAAGYNDFQRYNPDIVITDWLMEPMDGLDLTRKIRTHSSSPNQLAPVILVTGYCSLPRVHQARDAGITEFLVKPFRACDLAKRISHVVNNPRDFISIREFFGPDRRRVKADRYSGPRRRAGERAPLAEDSWTVGV